MTSEAIEMNNLGVTFLQKGKLSESLELFQGALQMMMFLSQGIKAVAGNEESTTTELFEEDLRIKKARHHLAQYDENSARCRRSKKRRSSISKMDVVARGIDDFVFTKAMYLPTTTLENENYTYQLKSSVVLFNTALAIHLQPGDMNQVKAETLYRMSYDIASNVNINNSTSNSPSSSPDYDQIAKLVIRLLMGLLNNMGQISYNLGNFARSRQLFEALSNFIGSLPNSENDPTLAEEKRGLLLNTYLLNAPVAAGAA